MTINIAYYDHSYMLQLHIDTYCTYCHYIPITLVAPSASSASSLEGQRTAHDAHGWDVNQGTSNRLETIVSWLYGYIVK